MQLKPEQLPQHLSRQLCAAYLIAGEEPLLVQEAADAVRARARETGYAERDVLHVEPGFDWQQLHRAGENLSLFATRRIIELRITGSGPGQEGAQSLVEYLSAPPADTLLLVTAGRLESKSRKSAWYEAFDRTGATIYVWPMSSEELPRWVERRMQRAGLSADVDAIQSLCQRTEGNLLACAQEIEKLALLTPGSAQRLTSEAVLDAVADSTRYDAADLVDKCLAGDAPAALQSLRRLQEEGEAAVLVIWTIARDLRTLAKVAQAIARGEAVERALTTSGVWQSRRSLFTRAARRLDVPRLIDMQRQTAFIDQVAKGALAKGTVKDEVWEELVKLTVRLAGIGLPGTPRPQRAYAE